MSASVKIKAFLAIILFSIGLEAQIATASMTFYCQSICSTDVLVSFNSNTLQKSQTVLLPQYNYLNKFIDENSTWNATNLLALECKLLQEKRLIELNTQISKASAEAKNKAIEIYLQNGFLSLLFQSENPLNEKLQNLQGSDSFKNASLFLEYLIRSNLFLNSNNFQSQAPSVNDLITGQNSLFSKLNNLLVSDNLKLTAVQKKEDSLKIWQLALSPYKSEIFPEYLQERLTTEFENKNLILSSKLKEYIGKQASLDSISTQLNLSTPALVSSVNFDLVAQSLTEAAKSESTLASKKAMEDLGDNPDNINYKKKIQALAERLDSAFCQKVSK